MKINKLLIPTLSALAIAPIAITGCSQPKTTEQDVLDAIFNPLDATATPISNFKTEFKNLGQDEWTKDLIYGTFGILNNDIGYDDDKKINIRDLYKNNEGAFKINITKCNVYTENNEFYGTLLGYVSYVFEKDHTIKLDDETELTFKANDFIMLTFDIVNAQMVIDDSDFSYKWNPKLAGADVGLAKIKYDGAKQESIRRIESFSTAQFKVKNSHNWVPSK